VTHGEPHRFGVGRGTETNQAPAVIRDERQRIAVGRSVRGLISKGSIGRIKVRKQPIGRQRKRRKRQRVPVHITAGEHQVRAGIGRNSSVALAALQARLGRAFTNSAIDFRG